MSTSAQDAAAKPLPRVHMFWNGTLSRIERLCMASYVACGHEVQLHVYEEPRGVPPGVKLLDARQIVPEHLIYRHEKTGSWALFADYFRFRVLFERGGIWSDTDVVCLQPLAYPQDEIYAWQEPGLINVAVLGLPAAHPLAAWMVTCCERPNDFLPYDDLTFRLRKLRRRWLEGDRRGNVQWGEVGPYGFTRAAQHFGHAHKALGPNAFYPVHWRDWRKVFVDESCDWNALLHETKALHLWNEMLRREGTSKDSTFPANSLYEQLCRRFLADDELSHTQIRALEPLPATLDDLALTGH